MPHPSPRLLITSLVAACLAVPIGARADGVTSVACSVAIDYLRNNVIGHAYRNDFIVNSLAPFIDDFSTPIRVGQFTASATRAGGETTVSVDYFNDVGVFVGVGFSTSLTIQGGGNVASTSGSHTTSVSSGVSPPVVGGNHTTNYTLSCRRL